MNRDLASNATAAVGLIPADYAADSDTDGAAIAVKDYRWAYVVLNVGDGTGVTTDGVLTVEESADGSTGWAAVSGATITATATTEGVYVGQIDCHKRENFLRVNFVAGATAPTAAGAVVVLTADRDTQYAGTPTSAAFSV